MEKDSLNARLSNIATDIVWSQAVQDKIAEAQSVDETSREEATKHGFIDAKETIEGHEDIDLQNLRELRLQRLKEAQIQRKKFLEEGGGQYDSVDEKEFLKIATSVKRVVCHFFHNEFQKCKTMDHHIERIAREHVETRFIRIDALKSPFLTSKLAIRVLPTVVVLHDGVETHRILGFQGLTTSENFKTQNLVRLLGKFEAVQAKDDRSSDEDTS